MSSKFISVLLLAFAAIGCSSVSLTVNSVPEKAKVMVRSVGASEGQELGVTPLVLNSDQLKSADAGSGPVMIEVMKDGFKTERVLITETASVDMKVNLALSLEDSETGTKGPGTGIENARSLNLAIDRLFEVRKFISLESYSEALNHLKYIEQTWPYLSATYEMKGGILFLQKKYRDALASYAMSLKYNPQSVPSAQMKESLEKKLGIDAEELIRNYELDRKLATKNINVKEDRSKKKRTKKKRRKTRRRPKTRR